MVSSPELKKDLQFCLENRKSPNLPTMVVGKKPNRKPRFNNKIKTMKNTLQACLPLQTSLVLFTSVAAQAADTTNVWTSTDGDPDNLAATIVLDSSANANGSISDIVSITLSDAVYGTYDVNIPHDITSLNGGTFSWDSTEITGMLLEISDEPYPAPHAIILVTSAASLYLRPTIIPSLYISVTLNENTFAQSTGSSRLRSGQ